MALPLSLAVVAVAVALAVTPGVGDAEQRAADFASAHHISGPSAAVPPRFAAALVATENSRFYSDVGVDPVSVARVAAARVSGRGDVGGATLEQQLVKQLYAGGSSDGVGRKAEQAVLAVKLYSRFDKDQILRMYASVVYFGHGYWGLDAASEGYFGRAPSQLSWGQAALLAGLLQAPSAYDPIRYPERACARQQHALLRLVATEQLSSRAAADAACAGHPLNGAGQAPRKQI
ncbi:biosynthetic peptidoglycan transglycosylase [Actinopolymorpha cephalotaxi]|uniref:Penicillin-binding protein 1A n=1 Tax=Actinopolymorpha cephalotaxi TaxID=504797 RepID=A0ABX2S3V8_9ACTN|nr:biosynthetic peptidoglycan transglycosylase [Actinopolymorpha cephalotaxi]NYH84290.1 penicillin-binding protein 1A [Actinopolymorpha cephalotaxi]